MHLNNFRSYNVIDKSANRYLLERTVLYSALPSLFYLFKKKEFQRNEKKNALMWKTCKAL